MTVYCASEKAIKAAAAAYPGNDAGRLADALIACHDRALGLDRSVCLRDVVERMQRVDVPHNEVRFDIARFLVEEFG